MKTSHQKGAVSPFLALLLPFFIAVIPVIIAQNGIDTQLNILEYSNLYFPALKSQLTDTFMSLSSQVRETLSDLLTL